MSRLVVVGSGTVVPEGDRGGSSFYVEMEGVRALVDCGPGAVQSLARHELPWNRLTHLVLTHFHADHVGALPGLFFSLKHAVLPGRDEPLTVWGPPGTRGLFEGLASVLGDYLVDPGFPLEIREIAPGDDVELSGRVRLRAHKTPHTDESHAVRLDGSDASAGYTGDTGPSPELGEFFEGTDVLVCECSLTDDQVGDNHLSPPGVAEIAARARPELLLLTHIYPHVRHEYDVVALVAAAGYAGSVALAKDGGVHALGPSPNREDLPG